MSDTGGSLGFSLLPVGFIRNLFTLSQTAEAVAAPRFSGGSVVIPPEVFGLQAYADPIAVAPRIDRTTAMQCGAVKRARNLIAGTLGGLPIDCLDASGAAVASALFAQPEADTPRSVTMARLFEDLLFEGVAWWRVVERGWHGYPVKVRRLDPRTVNVERDQRVYYRPDGNAQGSSWEWIPDADLIRFDSPTDPLLTTAARAIRTALLLEESAALASMGVPPVDYFTPHPDADPLDPEEVQEILDDWQKARQKRRTGYVPDSLIYNVGGWNPEQLQLSEARDKAVLEIARHAGIDPEDLGVSTTSRTYQNGNQRRLDLIDFTLADYLNAVQDRLSMNDVCPRGYAARADTTFTTEQPGQAQAAQAPQLQPSQEAAAVRHDNVIRATFDALPPIRLDSGTAVAFSVDRERRTISGLIVPFGVPARSGGKLWQFARGVLKWTDPNRVKLWVQHDATQAVGYATELVETDSGIVGTFKVARGPEGDRALTFAEDKVWDGFSIGLGDGVVFDTRDGINHVVSAPLMETSLTPSPSFDDARVHSVAASASTQEGTHMPDGTQAQAAPKQPANQTTGPVDFAALGQALAAFAATQPPTAPAAPAQPQAPSFGAPEPVAAGQPTPATLEVREGPLYRFDGIGGEHDFSTDVIDALKFGNAEANARVVAFVAEQLQPSAPTFAVTSAGVAALNPTQQRPDMYVDQLDYTTPLYSAFYKGGLTDATPFTFPKFGSSADLVDDHTEGVEPDAGTFTATSQTVTPGPLSGRVEIPREVWDQGGNPQTSGLIWAEMQRAWREGLEARTAALLAGLNYTGRTITLTAGGVDAALVDELEAALIALQFIRGGNRFTFAAAHVDLFTRLAAAKDGEGRKLLPVLNPTNAVGTADPLYSRLTVAGRSVAPSWALGASAPASVQASYLAAPADVHVWNSAPERLTFEHRVAFIDLAVWGYAATACSRLDGVRKITYKKNA